MAMISLLATLSALRMSAGAVGVTCTGSNDPPAATPYCYGGGQLGETVTVKVSTFASEQGTFDVTGSGLEKIDCQNKKFKKSGQTLSANLSDCVTPPLEIDSIEYCSDQDSVLVNSKVGPVAVAVPLTKVACPSGEAPTCTGSKDPSSAAPFCFSGSQLGESIAVKVHSLANEKGTFDVTGSGLEKIDCENIPFTKNGQNLTADLSSCVKAPLSVSSLAYCSDQDQILVNAKVGPAAVAAPLSKVPCSSLDIAETVQAPTCTGSKEPATPAPFCFSGSQLGESISVKVNSLANEKGTFDVTGSGLEKIDCESIPFTKNGQNLTADLSSCVTAPLSVSSLAYCSDQDQILVNAKVGPVAVAAPLSKVPCPSSNMPELIV